MSQVESVTLSVLKKKKKHSHEKYRGFILSGRCFAGICTVLVLSSDKILTITWKCELLCAIVLHRIN